MSRSTAPSPHPVGRAPRSRPRRLAATVPACVLLLVTALAGAGALADPASASCPVGSPDCGPPDPPDPPTVDSAVFTWKLQQLQTDPYSGSLRTSDSDVTDESRRSTVLFDGCSSTAAGTARHPGTIAGYRWTFSNGYAPPTSSGCHLAWARPLSPVDQAVTVTLTVVPTSGAPFSSPSQDVHYRDVVIASLGDSAASGQGAPDDALGSPGFSISRYCYRSGNAASALAAGRLQKQLGSAVTVHFWFLACSGATITARDMEQWARPPWPLKKTPMTAWGGLLSPYRGALDGHPLQPALEPQVARLGDLETLSGLDVDALLLTAGANDLGWGTTAEACLPLLGAAQDSCIAALSPLIARSVAALGGHFGLLADALTGRSRYDDAGQLRPWLPFALPPSKVFLTDYFDPMDSAHWPATPLPPFCGGEVLAGQGLRLFAVSKVEDPLQDAVAAAATRNHWNYR